MEVVVSRANIFDHSELLKLLIRWFDELSIEGYPYIGDYTGTWLADLISNHLVFKATYDDKIIGCIGLRISHFPWNNKVSILVNDFLMTDAKYRKTGVADRLLEACKKFSDESKLLLWIGHITGTSAETKDRYLKNHGFKYAGGNFIYKNGE